MSPRTQTVIRMACVAVLAGTLAGCGRNADETSGEAAATTVVSVRVAPVQALSVPSVVTAQGQWRAAVEVAVTAPFAAIVESLSPRVGDHVRKGDTIAQLVTRESHAALRGAELMQHQATDPASVAEAGRAVAQARHDLVRVPFVAMASGTVIRRTVDAGAEVAEGAEMFALVPENGLVFEAHVALADVGHVATGMHATIAMSGAPERKVIVQRRLPTTSAADQSALVWLSPAGAAPVGVLDQFGTATIEVGARRRVLAVPDSALVEDDLTGEVRAARVDGGGRAIWTTLRLGAAGSGWHELIEPILAPGTPFIIVGQHGLADSTRVKPQS